MTHESRRRQQTLVKRWNNSHPPGTHVLLTRENGAQERTKTTSAAVFLGGHTAVVWLEGVSGCYLLERCRAIAPMLGVV